MVIIRCADTGFTPPANGVMVKALKLEAGINYYRIIQTDRDDKYSYSEIKSLKFSATDEPFTIMMANPVINGILTVQVNIATGLALYNANGKLLWQQQVNAGTKNIDVSRYAKGIYLIKANNTIQKIVIQ